MAVIEINSYSLRFISGDQAGSVRARIDLWDAKGSSLGHLVFVEAVTPPASVDSPPILYFPVQHYADMVDMLRNESPVYLTFDATKTWAVTTKPERAGEGEPASRVLFPFKPA